MTWELLWLNFKPIAGWAILIALSLAALYFVYTLVCRLMLALDRWADRGLQAIAPDDLDALINATREPPCTDPPCSPEDYWACAAHRRVAERIGKHRAVWDGSLDDLDAPTIHEITDAAWRQR